MTGGASRQKHFKSAIKMTVTAVSVAFQFTNVPSNICSFVNVCEELFSYLLSALLLGPEGNLRYRKSFSMSENFSISCCKEKKERHRLEF